jgi:hypothetical protein
MDDLLWCIFSGVVPSDALLLKQIPKKQTGFVLVLNQNKPGLFF